MQSNIVMTLRAIQDKVERKICDEEEKLEKKHLQGEESFVMFRLAF
jgi:hypothetical protein